MKLIAVAELPDGANVQVQGLLVLPQTPAGITAAQPRVIPSRPIEPPEIARMFSNLVQAGLVEAPMQMPDGTVLWRQVTGFQFRLRQPNTAGNGAGQPKRIIVPGG